MTKIRVEHALGREAARQRFESLTRKHGIAVQSSDGGASGSLEKPVPFMGAVRARFVVLEEAIELDIVQAPAFLSPETIQRMVGDELRRALTG